MVAKREPPMYCVVCTMPIEYCEFSSTFEKCKASLFASDPQVFKKIYPDLTLEDLAIDSEKKPKTAGEKSEKEKRKAKAQAVIIKKEHRTKRKITVSISNLDLYDVDMKKTAKLFAGKFACGSSVTKNAEGRDDIVIQGDVQDEVYEYILENFKQIPEEKIQLVSK